MIMETASFTGLIAVVSAFVALLILQPIAGRFRLVDMPNHRKAHKGAVPLIGGLSAFAGLLVAWLISMPLTEGFGIYLFCALMLVILGAIDDARDIPARYRLWAQVLLGALLSYGSGIYLTTFGNLFGFGNIELAWLGPVVTIAAVIGATNAYNMIDGIDGLAGTMSLVTLGALAMLFALADGYHLELALAITIGAALLPYLGANLQLRPFRRKIFMGDAGSMFIGLAIVWLLTLVTQPSLQTNESTPVRPVIVLWFIAVPLMDMLAIMFRRAAKGQSPFKPDRNHLHHIFMRAGFTSREALLFILSIALIKALLGIALELFYVADWIVLSLFVAVFVFYCYLIKHAWKVVTWVKRHSDKKEG